MTDSSPTAAFEPPRHSPDPSRVGLLRVVTDALRGVELDLTQAPLNRAIVMLAVPMVLEMVWNPSLPSSMFFG